MESHEKLVHVLGALVLVLLLAATVRAQEGRVSGQVLDMNGKPWADVTVTLKSDTGRTFTLKTDKDGKYSQIGIPGGIYLITLTDPANPAAGLNFTEKQIVKPDDSNVFDFNFKELMAQQQNNPANADEEKKRAESQNAFRRCRRISTMDARPWMTPTRFANSWPPCRQIRKPRPRIRSTRITRPPSPSSSKPKKACSPRT